MRNFQQRKVKTFVTCFKFISIQLSFCRDYIFNHILYFSLFTESQNKHIWLIYKWQTGSLKTGSLAQCVECLQMVRKTGVQPQVESYQRLKKWYLIPPCLTLSVIRYVSMVKWNNQGEGVVPYHAPRCSSYWKRSLRVTLDYSHQPYNQYWL